MITFLIIVISIIIGIILSILFNDIMFDTNIGSGIFGGFIGLFCGLFLTFLISGIISGLSEHKYYISDTKPIYAIQDNSTISGSFFLGCGSVNGDMKYVYLVKDEYGMKMESIDYDDVSINESNKPCIITYTSKYKNGFLQRNFIDFNKDKTVINVPKETIKYNFNIDLK